MNLLKTVFLSGVCVTFLSSGAFCQENDQKTENNASDSIIVCTDGSGAPNAVISTSASEEVLRLFQKKENVKEDTLDNHAPNIEESSNNK